MIEKLPQSDVGPTATNRLLRTGNKIRDVDLLPECDKRAAVSATECGVGITRCCLLKLIGGLSGGGQQLSAVFKVTGKVVFRMLKAENLRINAANAIFSERSLFDRMGDYVDETLPGDTDHMSLK